jgi:hypothetical protein
MVEGQSCDREESKLKADKINTGADKSFSSKSAGG